MVINGFVVASTHHGCQLFCQYATHAHRVHLDEFREHAAKLARQVVTVLLHLTHEMLAGEQGVKPRIGRGVNIGGNVFRHIVNGIRHQVFVQAVEHIAYGLAGRVAPGE